MGRKSHVYYMGITIRSENVKRKDINRQLRGILLKHVTSKAGLCNERLYMRPKTLECLKFRVNEFSPDVIDLISQSGCSGLLDLVLDKLSPEQKLNAVKNERHLAGKLFNTLDFKTKVELIRIHDNLYEIHKDIPTCSTQQIDEIFGAVQTGCDKRRVWDMCSQKQVESLVATHKYTTFLIEEKRLKINDPQYPETVIPYLNLLHTKKDFEDDDVVDTVKEWLHDHIDNDISIKIKTETPNAKILVLDCINNLETIPSRYFYRTLYLIRELIQGNVIVSLNKPVKRNVSVLLLDQILNVEDQDCAYYREILSNLIYKDPAIRSYLGKIAYTKGGDIDEKDNS